MLSSITAFFEAVPGRFVVRCAAFGRRAFEKVTCAV
jgi:hypothetical protein